MDKSFVNSKHLRISGSTKIEAEKQKLPVPAELSEKEKKEFIEKSEIKTPILLNDKSQGVLLGICAEPSLKTTTKDIMFEILDDGTVVAKISKNKLIEACQNKMKNDINCGVTYLVPLFDHAINLDYRFQNRIDAVGDITGIYFYFQ